MHSRNGRTTTGAPRPRTPPIRDARSLGNIIFPHPTTQVRLPLIFPPQTWPNRSPAVYQQLVHTWNDLRPDYQSRVRETIHVAVRDQLVETYPTARQAPDMAATGYNAAAMDRILAEPAPVPAVSTRPAVDLAPAAVGEPAVPDVPSAAGTPDDAADAVSGGDAGDSAADAPLDEPSPAATVGYLSSRVFAITNGRSSAVVVPDSRRRANVSCARLLVQRALGSGG
jgi:hypothetical protein